MTLSVRVKVDAEVVYETWALNEATVEKASRERMLEVVIEVDGRPLSTFGCDGVVMSTPPGRPPTRSPPADPWSGRASTRCCSCRCARTRCSPGRSSSARSRRSPSRCSTARRAAACSGATGAAPSSCRAARASSCGARRCRCASRASTRGPFTDRLVNKFCLPVTGWRGPVAEEKTAPVIEEISIRDLGVIGEARLPLGPGFTALTGETGAGKTMVVTALGLLLGERADAGGDPRRAARRPSSKGAGEVDDPGRRRSRARRRRRARCGRRRRGSSSSAARSRPRAAAAPSSAAARPRSACSTRSAEQLVVVHGQSDQMRLRSATAQREALDRFAGAELGALLGDYQDAFRRWQADAGRARRARRRARPPRPRGRGPARSRSTRSRRSRPQRGEDVELAERAERLSNLEDLRIAAAEAHEAISSELDDDDGRDAVGLVDAARRAARTRRRPRRGPRADRRGARRGILHPLRPRGAARQLPRQRWTPTAAANSRPCRSAAPSSPRSPASTADARRRDRPARHRQRPAARARQRRRPDRRAHAPRSRPTARRSTSSPRG